MEILTHRGLDPSINHYHTESSFEAFIDQAHRGFGLEFDIVFTLDNEIVISHDKNATRVTNGILQKDFSDTLSTDLTNLKIKNNTICFFEDIMEIINNSKARYNALHFKGHLQTEKNISILINKLNKHKIIKDKLIIFDIKIETAKVLKSAIATINLAPSVAHDFDIKRYNNCVDFTLLTVTQALQHKALYNWVWLDEWDRINEKGTKTFYSKRTFNTFKNADFKIALVTPELHATSPALAGGETHADALTKKRLIKRMQQIIQLEPNVICTDYPDALTNLL